MNAIIRWLLRAKHWHIFLCYAVAFLAASAARVSSGLSSPALLLTLRGRLTVFSIWIPCLGLLQAWLWSVGSFLNSISQPTLRRRLGFFGFSIIYTMLYVFFLVPVFPSSTDPVIAVLMLPLHPFAMFSLLYSLYFVSKTLVQAETGKPASFRDYAAPFFLLWLFPVGVWFTQPRINRLYEQHSASVGT